MNGLISAALNRFKTTHATIAINKLIIISSRFRVNYPQVLAAVYMIGYLVQTFTNVSRLFVNAKQGGSITRPPEYHKQSIGLWLFMTLLPPRLMTLHWPDSWEESIFSRNYHHTTFFRSLHHDQAYGHLMGLRLSAAYSVPSFMNDIATIKRGVLGSPWNLSSVIPYTRRAIAYESC